MIAERQPEDCPAEGNKVSLASMGWLYEIQYLQEITVNQKGFWCLKEEVPSPVPNLPIEHKSDPAVPR